MVIRPTRCSSFTTNRFRGLVTVAVVFVLHVVPVAAEETDSSSLFSGLPLIVQLLLLALLIALSGVFAGLTLGVMGLDTNSLEIIADAGQEPERSYAKELMPVRKLGHQSLSTLILGNMLANVLISQLIAALTPEGEQVVSFITATLVILIFAEVLPLSVCRGPRALEIAAAGVPILRAFLIILYPIAKPLGMLLDLITPHDAGQVYDRNELRKLMHVHCKAHGDGAVLESTELKMLLGAMDFHECIAGKAMTPISDVFMLEDTAVVNQEMIEMLWREGKSRVPIYQKVRNNVIGILFVKDMISMLAFRSIPDQRGPLHSHVVPSQQLTDVTVGSLLGNTSRDLIRVRYTCTLPQVLAMFQAGTLHMLLVEEDVNQYGASYGRFAGIITLEDVIEELIKGEIRDEYDDEDSSDHEFEVNISTSEGEDQAPPPPHAPMAMTAPPVDDTFRTPLSTLTSLHHTKRIIVPKVPPKLPRVNFNSFYLTGQLLSCDHRWVLADFLQRSVGAFALWKLSHIKLLLDEVGDREVRQVNESDVPREILHRDGSLADSMLFNESSASFTPPLVSPTTAHQTGFNARGATGHMAVTRQTRSDLLLYEYGRASTAMTIVLHGGVRMLVGDDLFNHEARSFTILGEAALNTVPTQGAGGGASHKLFIPDFTAIVSRPSRLLTIHTRDYDRVDGYFQNKVCSKSFAQRMEQEEVRPNRWNESLPT